MLDTITTDLEGCTIVLYNSCLVSTEVETLCNSHGAQSIRIFTLSSIVRMEGMF